MVEIKDRRLDRMTEIGEARRRNGCYRQHLLTELGEIKWAVPPHPDRCERYVRRERQRQWPRLGGPARFAEVVRGVRLVDGEPRMRDTARCPTVERVR